MALWSMYRTYSSSLFIYFSLIPSIDSSWILHIRWCSLLSVEFYHVICSYHIIHLICPLPFLFLIVLTLWLLNEFFFSNTLNFKIPSCSVRDSWRQPLNTINRRSATAGDTLGCYGTKIGYSRILIIVIMFIFSVNSTYNCDKIFCKLLHVWELYCLLCVIYISLISSKSPEKLS